MEIKKILNIGPLHFIKNEEGFTLLEIVAVVAILSVLGSFSISNISKWTKLSKIDEAMTLLNNSLVDCLASTRSGTDPATVSPPTNVIDDTRLESSGYKIKDSKNKCSDFFITPKDTNEKVLFEMGYQITADNQVTKISTPADDQAGLNRCKRWGGPNCGASDAQKAAWAAAAALAAEKKLCNDNFYSWLNDTPPSGGTGSFNRWDSTKETCTLTTFAFEGSIVANQAAVDASQEAKLGAICNAKVLEQKDLDPPTTGVTTLSECAGKTFYFCLGEDKQTESAMNACIAENQEAVCIANREQKRQNNHKGEWGPFEGPGTCGETYWMCNKVQFTSKSDYDASTCGQEQKKAKRSEQAIACLADQASGFKGTLELICVGLADPAPEAHKCNAWCSDKAKPGKKGFYPCMGKNSCGE